MDFFRGVRHFTGALGCRAGRGLQRVSLLRVRMKLWGYGEGLARWSQTAAAVYSNIKSFHRGDGVTNAGALRISRSAACAKRGEPISASNSTAKKLIRIITFAFPCKRAKVKGYG
jgi:hypothetical protein